MSGGGSCEGGEGRAVRGGGERAGRGWSCVGRGYKVFEKHVKSSMACGFLYYL